MESSTATAISKAADGLRIRQPGEELVTVELTRAAAEIPAGARFTAEIGHDLAHRTTSGNLDGNGVVKPNEGAITVGCGATQGITMEPLVPGVPRRMWPTAALLGPSVRSAGSILTFQSSRRRSVSSVSVPEPVAPEPVPWPPAA